MDKNFRIYSSSAGSGKTYTLTKEYLRLVIRKPLDYKHIMAVTFTNKATAEMKTRIVKALHELSEGKPSPLASELMTEAGLDAAGLQARASEVLHNILHDYTHFTISTIDSFFQKIIRSFARETELGANFILEMDQEKVLNELVDKLLAAIGQDKRLTDWLTDFALQKIEDGKDWDFRNDIKELAREMFKEQFKKFENDITPHLNEADFLRNYMRKVRAVKDDYEKRMHDYGVETLSVLERNGLLVEDFSYGKTGVVGFLSRLKTSKSYELGTRAKDALLGADKWYSKSSKKKAEIEAAVNSGLMAVLEHVVNHYEANYAHYVSAKEVLRFMYALGILTDLTQKLADYRKEHNAFLISDGAYFLNQIVADNDVPYIYEKVGSTYKHYLIDEFQDTSAFQWSNLRPLVANSIASGHFNLVVGDVKQSIYRWRGGDWKLLLEQITEDIGPAHTERLELTHNWRSMGNVINFNNGIFRHSPVMLSDLAVKKLEEAKLPDKLKEHLQAEAEKLILAYRDVYQHIPEQKSEAEKQGGYVNFTFLENEKESEQEDDENADEEPKKWKDKLKAEIPALVERLQDQGFQLSDIAFLVRTKKEGKELAEILIDYKASAQAKPERYGYEVISSESLYLSSASVVRLLISTFCYLKNTSDKIAVAQLLHEYQRYTLGRDDIDYNELFGVTAEKRETWEIMAAYLPDEFIKNRPYFNKLPLYELSEALIRIFKLNEAENERAYLQTFLDLVLEYCRTQKADISSFLDWWAESGTTRSVKVSETQNAMQILTVHRSKGLEYPVVIVPFCNWELDHSSKGNKTNIMWCHTDVPPFADIPTLPLKYSSNLCKSVYAKDYFDEMIQAYLDNLNVLYVAFTRAADCLFGFAPLPKPDKKGGYPLKNVADLLFQAFNTQGQPLTDASGRTYIDLSENWDGEKQVLELGALQNTRSHTKAKADPYQLHSFASEQWRKRLTIRPQSKDFFMEDGLKDKINYGLLMHDILATIKTQDDLQRAFAHPYYKGEVNEAELKDQLQDRVANLFEKEQIREWFAPHWHVKNETDILLSNGEMRRPDRVMIHDNKAVVVDFKTGGKSKHHLDQVREYIGYLREMGYTDVSGYVLYLNNAEVVDVN